MIKNRLGHFYYKTFAASNPSFGLEVTNQINMRVKLMV